MSVLLSLLLSTSALGGPPTASVDALAGSGTVRGGGVSTDGEVVVMVGGGTAWVTHVPTWTQTGLSDCSVTAAGVVELSPTSDIEVWVGCDDGTVLPYLVLDGVPLRATSGDSEITLDVDEEGDPIVGLHGFLDSTGGNPTVYAVSQSDADVVQITQIDPEPAVPTVGLVAGGQGTGYTDSSLGGTGTQFLYVGHDNALMTTITAPGNVPVGSLSVYTGNDDMVALPSSVGQALVVDRGTGLATFQAASKAYTVVLNNQDDLQAVGASPTVEDSFALVVYRDQVDVVPLTNGTWGAYSIESSFAITSTVRQVLVADSGYTFAGTTGGDIEVWTDKPWIRSVTQIGAVEEGEDIAFSFETSRGGDWTVRSGGTWDDPTSGTELASGEATSAGTVSTTLSASDFGDGDTGVYVYLTDDAGLVGHGFSAIEGVDAAPGRVVLSESSLGFGDGRLTLSFTALSDTDIDRYTVYVTTTPFVARDHPSGGPSFDGDDELDAPIDVTDFTAGRTVEVEISPLTNDQVYYLAVRATDASGQEGSMSNVVEGIPLPTFTASDRAGEAGGLQCSTTGGAPLAGWLGGLGLVVAGLRRRRRTGAALRGLGAGALVLAAVGLGSLVASPALAQDDSDSDSDEKTTDEGETTEDPDGELGTANPTMSKGYVEALEAEDRRQGDLTEAWGNVELRYAYWQTQEPAFEEVFGKTSTSAVLAEFGPQLFRVVEIDLGAGLARMNGFTVNEAGEPSTTETRLIILPLSASITPRLHLFDEQPVVPYASVGGDWWVWREREGSADAENKVISSGSRFGWHWEVGLNLLLDVVDRRRASLLEAQSGINDSWLTLSYRRQTGLTTDGFDFSGGIYQVGLKLDF